MAKKLNISQGNYSKIEMGIIDIGYSRLENIAAILQIDVINLIKTQKTRSFCLKEKNKYDRIYDTQIPILMQIIEEKQCEIEELKKEINSYSKT